MNVLSTFFKYLGKVLAAEDDEWLAVGRNLRHARQKWKRLTWILSREGAYEMTPGHIYLVVVQSVLMYGSDTWVPKPRMKRFLGRFHHRVARSMIGQKLRKGQDGVYVYPLLEDVMAVAGL